MPAIERPHCILCTRDLGILSIFLTDFGDWLEHLLCKYVTPRDISKKHATLVTTNDNLVQTLGQHPKMVCVKLPGLLVDAPEVTCLQPVFEHI